MGLLDVDEELENPFKFDKSIKLVGGNSTLEHVSPFQIQSSSSMRTEQKDTRKGGFGSISNTSGSKKKSNTKRKKKNKSKHPP